MPEVVVLDLSITIHHRYLLATSTRKTSSNGCPAEDGTGNDLADKRCRSSQYTWSKHIKRVGLELIIVAVGIKLRTKVHHLRVLCR